MNIDEEPFTIVLSSGVELTIGEVVDQLDAASRIIEKIGTTGAETSDCLRDAEKWLKHNYPALV